MKPENRFLNRLKPKVEHRLGWYVEKTNNPYRSGTPDWYVEWLGGSGWIEAKFWNIKTRPEISSIELFDKCTTLQQEWLKRSSQNKVPSAVLCGFPDTKVAAFLPLPFNDLTIEVVSIGQLLTQLARWANNQ